MQLRTIQNVFFVALLVLTTVAFFRLIEEFLMPVFWAVVLAILFQPLQRRWHRTVNGRTTLASVLTTVTILFIVILPLFLVGLSVSNEAITLYGRITSGEIDLQEPIRFVERTLPVVTEYLGRFGIEIDRLREGISGAAVTASQLAASQALAIGQNTLTFAVMFFLMLYLLFFFLRDGERLIETFIRALPLGDVRERRLFKKFAEVSRATIKGTLVVGVVQGALGGLMFWILGLPAPVFWGVIMALLSVLPAVGSGLVWLPAAIILIVTGHFIKGILLILAGSFIIGLVDNILRPILVGRDTQMPDYLVLLSTLGGITIFGISGFVIGPVIAAFFLVVWEMFTQEFGSEDDARRTVLAAPNAREQPAEEVPERPAPIADPSPGELDRAG